MLKRLDPENIICQNIVCLFNTHRYRSSMFMIFSAFKQSCASWVNVLTRHFVAITIYVFINCMYYVFRYLYRHYINHVDSGGLMEISYCHKQQRKYLLILNYPKCPCIFVHVGHLICVVLLVRLLSDFVLDAAYYKGLNPDL